MAFGLSNPASLRIGVEADFAAARRAFAGLGKQEIAKRAAAALNATAAQGNSEVRIEMTRIFDRPTPYTLAGAKIKPARDSDPRVEITLAETPGRLPLSKPLAAEIGGGQRALKGFERKLAHAGILPSGWQTAPGPAAKLDPYGNMPGSQIVQILAYFQTFNVAKAGRRNTNVAKARRGTRSKYGYEMFAMPPGGTWPSGRKAQPGIYVRRFIGTGPRGGQLASLDLLLTFIPPPSYRPRLRYAEIIETVAARDLPGNLAQAFAKPIAS